MAVPLVDLQVIYGVAGAREQFEHLCGKLVGQEFSGAASIHVHKGDGVIDVYDAALTNPAGVHVFQVQYFPAGVGESQHTDPKLVQSVLHQPAFQGHSVDTLPAR